ncbi:MAG: hypothetical protein ACEQSH_00940 [Bacteroidia bacterium]
MASPYSATIKGYAEIQEANRKLVYATKPQGAFGAANKYATLQLMRGVRVRAHVDTGTYRSSISAEFNGLYGRVYVAPNRNPKGGGLASVYGAYEEARGGGHAAFANATSQDGDRAAQAGIQIMIEALP